MISALEQKNRDELGKKALDGCSPDRCRHCKTLKDSDPVFFLNRCEIPVPHRQLDLPVASADLLCMHAVFLKPGLLRPGKGTNIEEVRVSSHEVGVKCQCISAIMASGDFWQEMKHTKTALDEREDMESTFPAPFPTNEHSVEDPSSLSRMKRSDRKQPWSWHPHRPCPATKCPAFLFRFIRQGFTCPVCRWHSFDKNLRP